MKSQAGYIVLAVASVVTIVAVELSRPPDIDWSLSLSRHDKTPYGAYVLHHFLPEAFPGRQFSVGYQNIVTEILEGPVDSLTYVLIDDDMHFDEYAADLMLDDAKTGVSFFLSAFDITGPLADSLGFATETAGPGSTDSLYFASPAPAMPSGYSFLGPPGFNYFSEFDASRTTVLAYDGRDRPVYVRIDLGKGHFFLSLSPLAFTNRYILDETTAGFAFESLSYLPDQDVRWNEYHKPAYRNAQSLVRFVLRTDALRWAYYSGIAFVLLFVGFHARRRQRIVPLLPEKRNVTVEFTETIGRLYESHRSHRSVAEKRAAYFLNYIRTHLRVNTETFDDSLIQTVADRSGVDRDIVRKLFARLGDLRTSKPFTEHDLASLNTFLEDFYENASR